MEVDLIFKIAAVGILVAVLNILLSRSGRDEQALMTTIAGLVVVLAILVQRIAGLFDLIKELFSLFDGLVFSGPIGMIKPSREIFEHLLEKYSLDAKECIFIDDSELNINGAKAAGLNTYRFDGNADKLREYLRI